MHSCFRCHVYGTLGKAYLNFKYTFAYNHTWSNMIINIYILWPRFVHISIVSWVSVQTTSAKSTQKNEKSPNFRRNPLTGSDTHSKLDGKPVAWETEQTVAEQTKVNEKTIKMQAEEIGKQNELNIAPHWWWINDEGPPTSEGLRA